MTNGEVLALPDGTISGSTLPGVPAVGMPLGASREAPTSPQKAAEEFEAYVLKLLLQEMRRTVGSGNLFPGGGSGVYQSMLEDAMARRAAEAGTFGLAEQLLRDWGAER
jgi:Rod binding domain-containing protein